jgi:pyruvate kinase
MLSGETASGAWPEAAVETMDRIARATEASSEYERYLQRRREALDGDGDPGHVIADSASWTADRIGASCIVIPTLTGYTAQLASKHRS